MAKDNPYEAKFTNFDLPKNPMNHQPSISGEMIPPRYPQPYPHHPSHPPPQYAQVVQPVDPRFFQFHPAQHQMMHPHAGMVRQPVMFRQYYRGPVVSNSVQPSQHMVQPTASTAEMRASQNQPIFMMQSSQPGMPQFVETFPMRHSPPQEYIQPIPNHPRVFVSSNGNPSNQQQPLPTHYHRGPMMKLNQPRPPVPMTISQRPMAVQTVHFDPQEQWRSEVTQGLREHLVKKIIASVIPSNTNSTDPRYLQLCDYGRNVEDNLYKKATSKDDYFRLVAEKIHAIGQEMALRRAQRPVNQRQLQENSTHGNQLLPTPPQNELPALKEEFSPVTQNLSVNQNEASGQFVPSPHEQKEMALDQNRNYYLANGLSSAQIPQPIQPMQGPLIFQVSQPQPVTSELQKLLARPPSNEATGPANKRMKMESPSPNPEFELKAVKIKDCSDETAKQVLPTTNQSEETKPFTLSKKERAFEPDELRIRMRPVLEKLCRLREAEPFLEPVDPVALGCPDYLLIVKKPMDLSTILTRLDGGEYIDAWDLCDEMWLMFQNCWLYNRKHTAVYKMSLKLSKTFVEEMNSVMKEMGYCCADKLQFTFLPLLCYGTSQCLIQFNEEYMCYEKSANQMKAKFSERYTYCLECFDSLVSEEGVSLSDDPNDTNKVLKTEFKKFTHNQVEYEAMEKCTLCNRRWHKICALYNQKASPKGFICSTCQKEQQITIPENKWTARNLAHNKLSTYLEERVEKFLKTKTADLQIRKPEVIIRVLYSEEKILEARKEMKERYSAEGFPEKIPYRSKAIFAYQQINDHEVCFFGMYVQEYGADCGGNNQRRVYISYLDSVNFFEPRDLRTDVYYEILLGYLQYVKDLGFTMAHLWACPPSKGDDYIFHCHPANQKIPNATRLRDWYCRLLNRGKEEGIVCDYKDIYEQANNENLTSPAQLPYFEGDLWPRIIEDCIRDARNEERKRKLEMTKDEKELLENTKGRKKKGAKPKKKYQKVAKKIGIKTGDDVMDRIYDFLQKHKDAFFTIELFSKEEKIQIEEKEIKDPDSSISSDLMEMRDGFLTKARDENWEFSSLRRAQYATLCMSYALHNDKETVVITCNRCNKSNARWHCRSCEDFDLCNDCKHTQRHEHPLELIEMSDDQKAKRQAEIKQTIAVFVHSRNCRDANCTVKGCLKMKKLLLHRRVCQKRNSGCLCCLNLLKLCCAHSKECTNDSCQVPNCAQLRLKLIEIQQMKTRRFDMMMRRRMDGM